ncbi:MAG TPA: S8 family serine peptidase, partial [Chitinophagales bacterium]|nr:S8 family serine peptidase [Chitinophagales bacterium]
MRFLSVLVLVFAMNLACAQIGYNDPRVLNQYLVMLKPGIKADDFVKAYPSVQVNRCLSKHMNIWLLNRNTTTRAESFLAGLQKSSAVKMAQFNHHLKQRSVVPNDSLFGLQWNLFNTGQNGGNVGADIDAPEGWAINHNNVTATGDSIVIAIIDGTFDLTHEDLNFFINYAEVPNNGIDDDGNGYIDDYYGWNVYDTSGNINLNGGDPHSMHVAGIAGAIGNNQKGIAGVCWGPKILRVAGATELESEAVAAYDYVIAMRREYNNSFGSQGAFVVATNSSFGVDFGNPADYPLWCAMYDSMGAVGILSATATANNPIDVDVSLDLPTACPSKWMVSVTNTTNTDHLNSGAAFGKVSIDIGAPGTGIYSTVRLNEYGSNTGTSMASPHIAGAIACLYAAACPKLINDYKSYSDSISLWVKNMLLSNVTRLSGLYNKTVTGGKLNLYHAINNVGQYNCSDCNYGVSLSYTQPTCSYTCNGSAKITVTGNSYYLYNWSNGTSGTDSIANLCPGYYSVTVTDTLNDCQQIRDFSMYKPDSLILSSITTIPVIPGDSGNIIVSAHEGNYILGYSLDSVNYQTGSTLIISSNGNYTVYVKSETGCQVQQNVTVTGIENIVFDNDWKLYPNPANDALN